MPASAQIIDSLTTTANDFTALATGWHLFVVTALVFAAAGWKPHRRIAAMLTALPCWSVAALAWYHGNPFNTVVFAALGVTLSVIASGLQGRVTLTASTLNRITGTMLIAFGLAYPHFLRTESWLAYLYASSAGLIPCPTLSLMCGVSLLADGFGSRAWIFSLMIAAAFYGIVGMAVLSVGIDASLLAGVLGLALCATHLTPGRIPSRMGNFPGAA